MSGRVRVQRAGFQWSVEEFCSVAVMANNNVSVRPCHSANCRLSNGITCFCHSIIKSRIVLASHKTSFAKRALSKSVNEC